VVPGSSVKGALRHRFTFHYARQVLEEDNVAELAQKATERLFGYAANTDKEHRQKGSAGLVTVGDLYIDTRELKTAVKHMTHTSVDRFTGGVRYGVLFMEELIWKHGLKLTIDFESPRDAEDFSLLDEMVTQAWECTLEDLVQGRLALGAASAKGHGFFKGKIFWCCRPGWMTNDHCKEVA